MNIIATYCLPDQEEVTLKQLDNGTFLTTYGAHTRICTTLFSALNEFADCAQHVRECAGC